MSREDIYLIIKGSEESTFDKKLDFMEKEVLNKYDDTDEQRADVKHKLSLIKHQFKVRWQAAHKMKAAFEKNNSDWLNGTTTLPLPITVSGRSSGRPEKSFTQLSERSKRRKTEELRSVEAEKLSYATHMKLRAQGEVDASKVVKDLSASPTRALKYRTAFKKSTEEPLRQYPVIKALAMYVEAGLSRSQYEIVRSTNPKYYPCYSVLQKAKKDCYPPSEFCEVTATCSEVQLQALLDHTACRLILYLKDVVDTLQQEEKQSFELLCKWGCDGTQQVQYKMKFENESDSDKNIFQSSVVPLQLLCGKGKKVVWQNPTPSSPRYCRPIRIRFVTESVDITTEEIQHIETQISELKATKFENIKVSHKLLFTMVDGKVCNAATHTTSTMRCYICDATSKEFNDLTKRRDSKKESLKFGLSILHARIRFFESLLHIAYKLPVKKWQTRTQADKDLVQQKKKEIQERFKNEMGLLVDVPKANFGNTNDGNTSRRFFDDYELSASITGIDVSLIYRFKIILEVLSSGYKINIDAFQKYARVTEELYVSLYNWYPMSPTIHKVLRHGSEVIFEAFLPIGQLSEEAAEARNKHIREYRLSYSRKFSRISCNMDVLNRLLLTSDPLLTSMRKTPKKKLKNFSKEALDLLLSAEPCGTEMGTNDESCEEEEYEAEEEEYAAEEEEEN